MNYFSNCCGDKAIYVEKTSEGLEGICSGCCEHCEVEVEHEED